MGLQARSTAGYSQRKAALAACGKLYTVDKDSNGSGYSAIRPVANVAPGACGDDDANNTIETRAKPPATVGVDPFVRDFPLVVSRALRLPMPPATSRTGSHRRSYAIAALSCASRGLVGPRRTRGSAR
jgi:hypothetical protein